MMVSGRNRIIGAMFLVGALGIGLPFLFDAPLQMPPDDLYRMDPPEVEPLGEPPESVPKPDVTVLRETRDEIKAEFTGDGFVTSSDTRIGEPVIGKADENTTQWAIQIASLSDLDSAREMAKELNDDGFSAWVSDVRMGVRVLHRVIVGPMTVHAEAIAASSELAAKYQVEPILVSFSAQ